MSPLSVHDIIHVWETGQNQHPLDKALTIISAAHPEIPRGELAKLTIGHRDKCLLELCERNFGSKLKGFAECPHCSEHLEVDMSTTEFRNLKDSSSDKNGDTLEYNIGDIKINYRLPNSIDLAAVAECKEVKSAYNLLVERCFVKAASNEKEITINQLSDDDIDKLAVYMTESDQQAEILLNLQCMACNHTWQITFDIVTFLWKEISDQARRLLQEVHTLAFSYKWREKDILTMSPVRRKYYLEMLT
ncbi:MAG: phage baseplate protein [Candidatus Scalindua sp. AMX11]|nr:phage baseplate protein [Planctomycetota bacterium]RZV62004.1 MAG: phage baseplate protein [Candidatus Scalindua sp. SCAELEC01]TDE63306.1 MAG: phage baseplate protein [Candidatus Scalindua sp. AMX11]GJQ57403.1 MAG: hypothetical protein SCALA701_02040 [Candidatus Scalindua sp.]